VLECAPRYQTGKGISMSRRSGQNGWIAFRKGIYYARFWIDVPGRSTRLCKRVPICPASGPGSLNASERSRRLKQILVDFGANDEVTARATQAANLGTTFQEQATLWLESVQRRKRKPVKPRTAHAWKSYLKYINGMIGTMQLADVNNRNMKEFVAMMAAEKNAGEPRFSAKSIDSYLAVIKSVVASVRNENGEPVYSVKWNAEYMDVPVAEEQNTPVFTAKEIETIISKAEGQDRLLYALLAGTGLRIGEAFALKVEDIKDTVLHVKSSAWDGTLCSPKTVNGKREVDLHSSLAEALRAHIGERVTGHVFPSERGTPLRNSNLLRRSLHPILGKMGKPLCGFHAFRRFRAAHLDKELVPEILVHIWMGHSNKDMQQRYSRSGVKIDSLFRTMTAQKVALGFELPDSRPVAPKLADAKSLERWCARRDSNSRPFGS
jgi:integrase